MTDDDKINRFSELYKKRSIPVLQLQSQRRRQILDKQKQQRQELYDDCRRIEEIVEHLTAKPRKPQHTRHHPSYRNILQLSEWLRERPDDLEDWYLVPCPKGHRAILVATSGWTTVYNKSGRFQAKFHTKLPGDFDHKQNTTILDCIFNETTKEYYVLDVLAYANQDMINCEYSFRIVWICGKIQELELGHVSAVNKFAIKCCSFVDCANNEAISECLQTYPLWENNLPALDGLLFYHKESSYISGTTPLVGWLYPFMIEEILGSHVSINPNYLCDKPINYTNLNSFIIEYDEATELKKQKRRKPRRIEIDDSIDNMDDSIDEPACPIVDAEIMLEMEGTCPDDIHYDNIMENN